MTVVLNQPDHSTDGDAVGDAPSGTGLRFFLLVVAVLATSSIIFVFGYLVIPQNAEFIRGVLTQCGPILAGTAPAQDTLAASLERQSALIDDFMTCKAPGDRQMLTWALWGLNVQILFVAVLYAAHPWWLRRRGRLVPLDEAPASALHEELAALVNRAGLRRAPTWLLAPYSYGQSGQAFGMPWRGQVQLDVGLRMLFRTDRARFRAVVLHELAHLRNRDVALTYLTIAAWWAFVLTALVPLLVLLIIALFSVPAADHLYLHGWLLAAMVGTTTALTALVYAARNAVLRTREQYADVVASRLESTSALVEAIETLRWPPRVGRFTLWPSRYGTHPAPHIRRDTIREPKRLLRTGGWDVAAFGAVAGVVMTNLLLPIPSAMGSTVGSALVCMAVAGALAVFTATCARRAVVLAHPERPGPMHWWGVPVALSLGVSAGSAMSVISVVATPAATMGNGWQILGKAVLLFLGIVVVNAWFTSDFRASWRPAERHRIAVVPTAAAALIGAVFLFYWLNVDLASLPKIFQSVSPPEQGASIDWYSDLARGLSGALTATILLTNLPLGLVLVTLALLPLLRGAAHEESAAVRYRFALIAAAVAGSVTILVAAALPFAARGALPGNVRRPSAPFALGEALTFDVVFLYTYAALAAAILVVTAAAVAFHCERSRPALVALSTAVTAMIAAAGLYVLKAQARCANLYVDDDLPCVVRGIPLKDHTYFADSILAWASILAVPAALLSAVAGVAWRARSARQQRPRAPVKALGQRPRVLAMVSLLTLGAAFAATEGPRLWILLNPSATGAGQPAQVDDCMVGHWVEESRQQPRPAGPTQVATFTSRGATWSFHRNGRTNLYLGSGMVQAAKVNNSLIEYVSTGTAQWLVTSGGGVITFAQPKMRATVTYRKDGRQGGSAEFGPADAVAYALPAAYACTAGTMTTTAPGYSVTLHRIGTGPAS